MFYLWKNTGSFLICIQGICQRQEPPAPTAAWPLDRKYVFFVHHADLVNFRSADAFRNSVRVPTMSRLGAPEIVLVVFVAGCYQGLSDGALQCLQARTSPVSADQDQLLNLHLRRSVPIPLDERISLHASLLSAGQNLVQGHLNSRKTPLEKKRSSAE